MTLYAGKGRLASACCTAVSKSAVVFTQSRGLVCHASAALDHGCTGNGAVYAKHTFTTLKPHLVSQEDDFVSVHGHLY